MLNLERLDLQFLLPFLIIVIIFLINQVFWGSNKLTVAFIPELLFIEPYRIVTSHFIHADFNHLLANSFGIVVSRYFFKNLGLTNNYLFILLVIILIPSQTLFHWFSSLLFYNDQPYIAYGFSGIIYGVYSFILICASYGKESLIGMKIDLKRNPKVKKAISIIITLGVFYSLLPGISLWGHLSGVIAGFTIFYL